MNFEVCMDRPTDDYKDRRRTKNIDGCHTYDKVLGWNESSQFSQETFAQKPSVYHNLAMSYKNLSIKTVGDSNLK